MITDPRFAEQWFRIAAMNATPEQLARFCRWACVEALSFLLLHPGIVVEAIRRAPIITER